ncbi:MAG: pyrroline-5-carboxylate reductase [Bacteroidetes bacterium]|nr:MAG: pyrroline-5-carboxylate reductase [Bacteroidota bacterium]
MNILIIGAGNMGLTYGQSFIDASAIGTGQLYFLDRTDLRQAEVQRLSAHPLATQPDAFIRDMDLVIVAVKPQDFKALAASIKPFLRPHQLILSVMAGISVETLRGQFGAAKVVRAMPNLPAQVGQGMTVFTASAEVSRLEIFTVQNLLSTTGKTLYVEKEPLLDAATAISGSGPAFVFYFMEAMMQAGRQMGFSESEAQLLVRQTFLGSLDLLHRNSLHCGEWIRRVSSKGGTTEAALASYAAAGLQEAITAGLEAARQRAVELSGQAS